MPSNLPASPLFHRGDYSGGSGRSAPAQNTAGSGTTQPPAPSPAASPTTRKSLCDSLCRFMAGGQSQPHCAPCPSRPIWASSCLSRDSSLNKKLVIGPEGSEQGTLRHALPWNPPSPVGAAGQHHSPGGRGPCTGTWYHLLLPQETWGWISPHQRPHLPWPWPTSSPLRTGRRCACQQPLLSMVGTVPKSNAGPGRCERPPGAAPP